MRLERGKWQKGQIMRVISLTIGIAVFAGLAACGNNAKLMNLTAGQESPDEFAILPTRPISMPPDLALRPTPTPGGSNITDPTPEAPLHGAAPQKAHIIFQCLKSPS